jgi:HSP20 family molecular chaperone IbpA
MSHQTGLLKNESNEAPLLVKSGERPTIVPACDVYENKDEILVIADVPGIEADAMKINLEKGELVLEAHRDGSAKEGAFLGAEWGSCEFRRRFSTPSGIDANKIRAELKDGVMHLHLPKSEALKPRQIAVRAG